MPPTSPSQGGEGREGDSSVRSYQKRDGTVQKDNTVQYRRTVHYRIVAYCG